MTETKLQTTQTQPQKAQATTKPAANPPQAKPELPKKTAPTFSQMREVDIEEIWKDGRSDFADWLENNIEMLGDAIDITLVDIEKNGVSDFTAKQEYSGGTVLIETQFNHTTNGNLGRILSNAAGLNAKAAVWVVTQVRNEHKAAIKFLNNGGKADFYLIEVHAYKIGDSAQAIKFEVVEKP